MSRGFPSKLTPAERAAAVGEYLAGGDTLTAVAARHGISASSLHAMVQRRTHGPPARTRDGAPLAAADAHMRQAIALERIATALERIAASGGDADARP